MASSFVGERDEFLVFGFQFLVSAQSRVAEEANIFPG